MKIVMPATFKGGAGKTIFIFNTAGILAQMGKKILIIDNDPQGNSTNNCGISEEAAEERGSHEIFDNGTPAHELIVKAPIEAHPEIDIIPGCMFLHGSNMNIVNRPARETILKRWMKANMDTLSHYDVIFIDVNPTMSLVNQNSYLVADSIVLVSNIGVNSAKGAKYFVKLWGDVATALDIPVKIKGLMVTGLRSTVKMHRQYVPYLKSHKITVDEGGEYEQLINFEDLMIDPVIPINNSIGESEAHKLPVNTYKPSSTGAIAFVEIVETLVERGVF